MGQQLLTMKMFVVLALAAAALAEPEADALTYTTSPLLRAFNNVNLYNTAAVQPITTTYNHVATPLVHSVATPVVKHVATPVVQRVATPVVQSVATPFVQHVASPVVYAQSQVATHTITNYNNPEHYTAVSNGAVGPKYIAKNGPVQHIVKREAEAEADPLLVNAYNNIPAVNTYSHVAAVPQVYSAAVTPVVKPVVYNTAVTTPVVKSFVKPVVKSVLNYNAVPQVYNHVVATPAVYNTAPHAVALTPQGYTHSSNVGVCTNNVGAVAPC